MRPQVRTRFGDLQGVIRAGVLCCYGVPYASPPTGERRFRPAVPPEPWSKVRDATAPGLIAPQPGAGIGSYIPGDPLEQGEDCLTCNIFTAASEGERRPVVLFVHGGAFATGTGASVMYDGSELARAGVVVVTINYRLGALGFCSHPLLGGDGGPSGNWGASDVVRAVEFVHENIAAFGGDPGRITVVGESAGAMLLADLLASNALAGKVVGAVLESGPVVVDPPRRAIRRAERLAELLGLAEPSRTALTRVSTAAIVEATAALSDELGGILSMPFRPVGGVGWVSSAPEAALRDGAAAGVPVLIGSNRDEFKLFTFSEADDWGEGEGSLDSRTRRALRALPGVEESVAPLLLECYREEFATTGHLGSDKELFDALASDAFFRVPMLRLAEAQSAHAPVYCYRFDWASSFLDGRLGACHGLELPFVFGNLGHPAVGLFAGAGSRAEELSERMRGHWTHFAEAGRPTPSASEWPSYLPGRVTKCLGEHDELLEAPGEGPRQLWESVLGEYGRATPAPHGGT